MYLDAWGRRLYSQRWTLLIQQSTYSNKLCLGRARTLGRREAEEP